MRLSSAKKAAVVVAVSCIAAVGLAPAPASAGTKAMGIDVSRFQGTIDWPTVATSGGIRFAFVQASRGSGADCTVKPLQCGADPYFASNRVAAEANGIRVGAYHRAFAAGGTRDTARADAIAEADVFLTAVACALIGELPCWTSETPFSGMTSATLRTWIRVWVKKVNKRLGRKPMIYTNASSWGATGNTLEFAKAKYPLWVAEWGVSRPSVPASNWAGRGYSVWQYSSSGTVAGISGNVDQDRLGTGLAKITVH
jgi:GH25 family lysozyme M1 (1,4-beta-N-acetylmuramidase)